MPTMAATNMQPTTVNAPSTPAARWQLLPQPRTRRIACIICVILVLTAVITAIILMTKARSQTPQVVPVSFGSENLWTSRAGIEAPVLVKPVVLVSDIINPNRYAVDFRGIEVSVSTLERATNVTFVKATRVALWPSSGDSEWPNITGGRWTKLTSPIKLEWPLTAKAPARVLTRALMDCGVEKGELPTTLVQEVETASNPKDATTLVVSVMARMVVDARGVHVAENAVWEKELSAAQLVCPDKASQSKFESIVERLNYHWNTTATVALTV
ncbi:hypothetical protein AMAG_13073 [Allomyces macrogynus ATCC 38327]|uniref:Late embryogenesis abundant protein LEA-2 subgroup domain-containing protein n=1 Tax=Allomyces macrogynus (strain ATCC 38327) TaxID=578462 RepID=A0A0L0T0V2_ALLM3|nr:hypothetical protein AMAG_13073 [Allomyces macrogynus ATCC 38327]|eukprot:KNE68418.1 hypothetical protein AMAG_13073 [Allomyces macrogynus ATCC 38327]